MRRACVRARVVNAGLPGKVYACECCACRAEIVLSTARFAASKVVALNALAAAAADATLQALRRDWRLLSFVKHCEVGRDHVSVRECGR